MTTENDFLPASECLDYRESVSNDCNGAVEYRIAMSPTGISYPRCEKHMEERWAEQERISSTYGVPLTYDGWDSFDERYDD